MSDEEVTFFCSLCKEKWKSKRPEEDVIKEKEMNFPGMPLEEMELVCTDCFKKVMDFHGRKNYLM
jgi:hypothetical protein